MVKKKKRLPSKYQPWVDARKRFNLSHAQIQMARELGMNPKQFGSLTNHKQEAWKVPLSQFIEQLYRKNFGREQPETVRSIEETVAHQQKKKAERKARREQERHGGERSSVNQEEAS